MWNNNSKAVPVNGNTATIVLVRRNFNSINHCCAEFQWGNIKIHLHFQSSRNTNDGSARWNPSWWKRRTGVSCTPIITVVDDLAPPGSMSSTFKIFAVSSWNITGQNQRDQRDICWTFCTSFMKIRWISTSCWRQLYDIVLLCRIRARMPWYKQRLQGNSKWLIHLTSKRLLGA